MDRKNSDTLGKIFTITANDTAKALKELSLPHRAYVLDVGTGKGYCAIYLALQGYNVLTGEPQDDQSVYANKDWLTRAIEVGVEDKITFSAFSAQNMPFPENTFDAVLYFGVLHHIAPALRTSALSESLRVAKPEGAVVFLEPNPETLEKVWVNDPDHPEAANPDDYIHNKHLLKSYISGDMMDIYIYKKLRKS